MRIKVKATGVGYYGHKSRKEGDKFFIEVDALKFDKVKDPKTGKEVEAVILPSWVKPLEKLPLQSEMRKALIAFQNSRKAGKIKQNVVLDPEPEKEEVEENDDDESDEEESAASGPVSDQEVI